MKRKILIFGVMLFILSVFTGCKQEANSVESIEPIAISSVNVENENATTYVVTFEIKQTHFTLDIGQHLKDEMNKITIDVMVDKRYYDSVSIGDKINNDFRVGSFIMKGSFGNWEVSVKDKQMY